MRKTTAIVSGLCIAILLQIPVVKAQVPTPKVRASLDGLALTPPMGWYPWNEFGQEPQNEKLVKEIVDALISSGMKDAGYEYVGPDEGICFYRGVDGKLTTNLQRYPSGLRALGDDLGHDVDDQEAHRAERHRAVHRLGDDPAAGGHDDAVGREQANADRRGEPDKGEDSTIKEQEMHERHVNGVPGRGYSGDDQHAHENS